MRGRPRPPPRWPAAARCGGAGSCREHEADAADGVDDARLAALLGLAAQVADVDVERVRRERDVEAPYALVDHVAREDLLGVAQEQLEQAVLGAGELECAAAARGAERLQVEHEVA